MSHEKCKTASLKCVEKRKKKRQQPTVLVVFHFLKLSHDLDSSALHPIRSVQETVEAGAQRPGGHGSASMLAPERSTTVKSVVYLEMNSKYQHRSDAQRPPRHRAHPCTYRWYLPVSVCECTNVFLIRLFVSVWVSQMWRSSVELKLRRFAAAHQVTPFCPSWPLPIQLLPKY